MEEDNDFAWMEQGTKCHPIFAGKIGHQLEFVNLIGRFASNQKLLSKTVGSLVL